MKNIMLIFGLVFLLSGCSLGVGVATSAVGSMISTGVSVGTGAVRMGASVTGDAIGAMLGDDDDEDDNSLDSEE